MSAPPNYSEKPTAPPESVPLVADHSQQASASQVPPPAYHDSTGGYSTQPGGYPPQQPGGYPPQQPGGYPPQQPGGYPAQQPGGYPPQQPGYPDSKQPYPPQPGYMVQPGYPAQGQAGLGNQPNVVVVTQQMMPTNHPDYLGFSIFNLLCCCLCIGIAALLKSLEVQKANQRGDGETARALSKQALKLNKIALGIGIALTLIYIALIVTVNVLSYRRLSYYY